MRASRWVVIAVIAGGALASGCKAQAPDRSCPDFAACSAACEKGNQGACTRVARFTINGKGTTADEKKGIALLEKACDADDAYACGDLGARYFDGNGVPRDVKKSDSLKKKALSRYERQCRASHVESCYSAANMRRHGRPNVRDAKAADTLEKKALELAERGCRENKEEDCVILAEVVDHQENHALNTQEGVERLDLACKGGAPDACWRRGSQAQYHLGAPGARKDPAWYYRRSVELYEKKCAADDARACGLLGSRLSSEEKFLGDKASDPAVPYAKACELGDSFMCSYASGAYGKSWRERPADPEKSRAYLKKRFDVLAKACETTPGQTCLEVAELLEGDRLGPPDQARADAARKRGLEALEKDCAGEDAWACNWLANHYNFRDRKRAAEMFKRTCELNHDEQACQQAELRKNDR